MCLHLEYAGGIGLSVHNIRATDSYIRGSNGTSNGIVPMLRVYNDTARYVDQGGGKRKGSFAIYLEPWHADIETFLDLKKNHGNELERARDLFYGLWIPDLFMRRVEANRQWSLMCPRGRGWRLLARQKESDERYMKNMSRRARLANKFPRSSSGSRSSTASRDGHALHVV